MSKSTLESLPNELLLMIFGYLSSFDLCQAFLDVKNARIEHLLTSIRHTLDVSSMHYNQLRQFLSNINNDTTKHFTALIDTVVFRHSPGCMMFLDYWEKALNDTALFNMLLPSIKQLLILNADYYQYGLIDPLLISLAFHNNTLQRLNLIFDTPTYPYSSILSDLVLHHISVHTMILEVEKGHEFDPDDGLEDLHKMQQLYWPNTVQLTLSIQHSSELMLLLQRGALPMIEHLNVTNEEIRTVLPLDRHKSVGNIQLCENDLRQIGDGTRLRSLLLRYFTLTDVIILIGSLSMPLLEQLILVDLYDHKSIERSHRVAIVKQILDASPNLSHLKIHWKDFRHCSQTYSNLKHVHFVLDRLFPEPKQHINVRQLTQLVPHLYSLETSDANIIYDENLVKFVLKIIHRFHQLVYLRLNKDGLYPVKEEKKIMFKERLIAAGHNRLFDCNNIQIEFPGYNGLCIWL
ncbi:unnamed protein product [Rotaria sordida]|uniref:F-box domain-containing protein n=1 Tax=Rotaria sordida TaxID=392033 RepID=A0A818PK01_9BILA|nr:unnamed protein product [Rotaria sordida]